MKTFITIILTENTTSELIQLNSRFPTDPMFQLKVKIMKYENLSGKRPNTRKPT